MARPHIPCLNKAFPTQLLHARCLYHVSLAPSLARWLARSLTQQSGNPSHQIFVCLQAYFTKGFSSSHVIPWFLLSASSRRRKKFGIHVLLCMHEFFQICFLQTVASSIRSSLSIIIIGRGGGGGGGGVVSGTSVNRIV